MVCFCFLVDQTRKVRRSKPAAGACSRCGGCASVADLKTSTRFCHVPFYWKSWRAITCTFCGAILRSYR
ncbi:Tyrosine-protein kinase receptor UFO like [Actinidia chinensis var. chinensis]|uniref:Tyrosine-protein kinase receptor UFO like n=1 Tax=Actinidia chinensis var. chinensis TaxID=1590841 RepID=A0A2R6PQJ3_ACTCC|nr:Tyrosine-protein kinase receptor UFO like [Actinidia chinensis var. chinensis]